MDDDPVSETLAVEQCQFVRRGHRRLRGGIETMEIGISEQFERRLGNEFEGDAEARRVVARQARDLADSGQFETDVGRELTASVAVENLRDAPEGLALPERWNWWMGALELAYGGYDRFRVLRWAGKSG